EEYDDLYAYLEITDYKGNKVPSDKEHITFDFSQVSSKPGEESLVPYEVRDDEGNTAQGSVVIIMKDKSPKVSIIGDMDTISIYNQEDIYKYVQIEDHKGNVIASDAQHITFDFPASMLIGKVYNVPYEVVDNEGNRGNGVLRVIMKDKSPIVTNISSTDIIEITNEQELYAYLEITDYKGNKVLSDAAHVTFQFPDVMEIGKEYEISYEVVDDEGNKSTGTLRVRKVGSNEEGTPPIENEPSQPSQPSQGESQEGKEENVSSANTGDASGVQNALLSLMGSTFVLYGVYRRYKKKAQSLN
ncbi:MAG: hypothetical protein K2F55_04605, partial [Erysipelotrichaceae bacterium]|nr:hypothetical protein [Erysipelotrichaceae bacterium]